MRTTRKRVLGRSNGLYAAGLWLTAAAVVAGLISACSFARVATKEVQTDGSYIDRGAVTCGLFANVTENFLSRWEDRQSSTVVFIDEMGWASSREIDAESLANFLDFAAGIARAAGGCPVP